MIKKVLICIKKDWYFIKQDIVSYLISTLLYIGLCLITEFTIQSVLYGLFECFVFYIPFWYIRVHFSDTYHSKTWNFCKYSTRVMLCLGVFVMWILPIKYTLFNSLFVAFGCCLILYLVAIEVRQKDGLLKRNKELNKEFELLLEKLKKYKNIDIYSMTEEELRAYAQSKGLSENICDTLVLKVIKNYRWVDIQKELNYTKDGIRYHKQKIIEKLEIDL